MTEKTANPNYASQNIEKTKDCSNFSQIYCQGLEPQVLKIYVPLPLHVDYILGSQSLIRDKIELFWIYIYAMNI